MKRLCALTALLVSLAALSGAAPAGAAQLGTLIAPPSACPAQGNAAAKPARQLRAMRCMTNYARQQKGIAPLNRVLELDRAGMQKSADIIRCDEFSHEACGREFTYWMEHFGYLGGSCARAGENIAWGSGPLGSVRSIFSAWIHSEGHRANILSGAFQDFGIGLRVGRLEGISGAHVWTQEFGSRSC
ncbi:MAG TPA: CAP domain-containing protein [Solirubrobacterales bacterium]|jgi:uncharacterized protein YkwD